LELFENHYQNLSLTGKEKNHYLISQLNFNMKLTFFDFSKLNQFVHNITMPHVECTSSTWVARFVCGAQPSYVAHINICFNFFYFRKLNQCVHNIQMPQFENTASTPVLGHNLAKLSKLSTSSLICSHCHKSSVLPNLNRIPLKQE